MARPTAYRPVQKVKLSKSPDEPAFWLWHQKHPRLYGLFEKYSEEAIAAGQLRFSPWLIAGRVRYQERLTGSKNKIQNGHIAFLSRLFLLRHPHNSRFFKKRKMKGGY